MGDSGVGCNIVVVTKKALPPLDFDYLKSTNTQSAVDSFRTEKSAALFAKSKRIVADWVIEVKELSEQSRKHLEQNNYIEWRESLIKLAFKNIHRLEEELQFAESKYGKDPAKSEVLQSFRQEWELFKDSNVELIQELRSNASSLHTIASTRSVHTAGKGRVKASSVKPEKKPRKNFNEL